MIKIINLIKTFKVNKVVKHFVLADLALFSGWGLVSPIFSVFVIRNISGATLEDVGIGAGIYWLTRSVLQIPLGRYLDSRKGEKTQFHALLTGLLLASLCAFSFTFISSVWELFLVQFIYGISMAFYTISWNAIFSNHLDKNKVAFEWALDNSFIAFASALTAFIGGYVANNFGFSQIFQAAGFMSLVSALIIFLVPDIVLPPKTETPKEINDHTPKNIGI